MAGPAMAVSGSEITRDGVRKVLWITLLLNVAVSAGKILVGKLSGNLAMVADATTAWWTARTT
jgi:divalent metal cation (Fe/Co/Zn/Cd) transporter